MDFKAVLMMAVNKIYSASEEAITILRDTPVSSLKVLRGIAKGDRDPDPLSSTMLQINRKFPITIYSAHPKFSLIPKIMLGPDDFHLYRRKLCKLEAVQKTIEDTTPITDQEKGIISVMYRQHDQDAQKYAAIDWRNAKISFGLTVLNKVYAPTRCPIINIPKPIREQMVLQTLCSDLIIPYNDINPNLVTILKQVIGASIHDKMTFMQQARILLNQLDARVKLQPLPPGYEEWMGVLRYALFGSRWTTTSIMVNESSTTERMEKFKNLIVLNKVCIKILQLKISGPNDLRLNLNHVKLHGELIEHALLGVPDTNNSNLKVLCVLIGISTTMSSELGRVTFSPAPSEIRPVVRRNLAGFQYKSYKGMETVYIRCDETTGMFAHDKENIFSVILTLTTPQSARVILATIPHRF